MTKRNWGAELAAPFPPEEIEWRIARSGKAGERVWAMCLAYVTSRAVMDRLDAVFGVGGWRTSIQVDQTSTLVCCRLEAKHPETGEWMSWSDGTGRLESNDGLSPADAGKGDISNALKRVAVQAGIGRYLYWLSDNFAECSTTKTKDGFKAFLKDKTPFWWSPPELPTWALPGGSGRPFEIKAPVVPEEVDEVEPEEQEEVSPVEDSLTVAFANAKAREYALEAGLTDQDFSDLDATPSGKGNKYTLPDVKGIADTKRGTIASEVEAVAADTPTETSGASDKAATPTEPQRDEPPTEAQMGRLKQLAVLFSENGYEEKLGAIRQKLAAKYTKATAGAAIKYMKEFLEGEGITWEEDESGN